jgi:Fe-S-cluster containining protein
MKQSLEITSDAFLKQYTVTLLPENTGFPLVVLKMREEKDKVCPFVGPSGCFIYEDRPWSCRMYPLDRGDREGHFRCIADPSKCLGMGEDKTRPVRKYLKEQGLEPYEEMEVALRKLTAHPRLSEERIENPKVQEMCRMALYDLDRFRRFVLESRFLDIFHVEGDTIERIKMDDVELMKLALRWLEFGLISGGTLKIREDILRGQNSKGPDTL